MISDTFRKYARFAWFLPGFLLWAAFPPMGEKTDVLFALAPLLWVSRQRDPRTSARRWFASGVVYWVATLSWMPAIVKNGGPWPLVVLGWFALAAYCAGYFALFGWLSAQVWRWARNGGYWRRIFGMLAEPVLWCGLELVRSRLFGGFAWNQLGVVPANGGFAAPAAVGGVYLLSAVVILINGTIAGIIERMRREAPKWAGVETLLSFSAVVAVYWASSFVTLPAEDSAGDVKVALVQRNFPCVFAGRKEENPVVVYNGLLQGAASLRPDLVILPESGLCEFGPVDQQGAARFARWVAEKTGAALLAGGTRYADGKEFNSAALFEGDDMRVYDKVHLVPFGEYIPGDKIVTSLQKFAPVGSCTPGELRTIPFKGGRLGVAICFEDTDSAQMRALADMGAGMLVFITNDSWFSNSAEAEQHAWQATARAVETGLPVVRVGNNGVTGTISPDGKASWLLDADGKVLVDAPGSMVDRIAMASAVGEGGARRPPTTPYVAVGDWPLGVTFALLIAAMILVKYARYGKLRSMSV